MEATDAACVVAPGDLCAVGEFVIGVRVGAGLGDFGFDLGEAPGVGVESAHFMMEEAQVGFGFEEQLLRVVDGAMMVGVGGARKLCWSR